jgi:predicted Mrr-cat superfamily restriction endonuclease
MDSMKEDDATELEDEKLPEVTAGFEELENVNVLSDDEDLFTVVDDVEPDDETTFEDDDVVLENGALDIAIEELGTVLDKAD